MYAPNPGSGTFVSHSFTLFCGSFSAVSARPCVIPVVATDNAVTKIARNKAASNGNKRETNPAARLVFFRVSSTGFSFAEVFELRPIKIAIKPDRPPTDASILGKLKKAIGPKITRVVAALQAIIAINTHTPKRAHHSL